MLRRFSKWVYEKKTREEYIRIGSERVFYNPYSHNHMC